MTRAVRRMGGHTSAIRRRCRAIVRVLIVFGYAGLWYSPFCLKVEEEEFHFLKYEEAMQSLKKKLEMTQQELASLKSQQAATIEQQRQKQEMMGGNTPNFTDSNEPDESHRFEHIVTTSKTLNQIQTKNLFHMGPVMRRSRPVIGNTERIHGFIQKLLNGKCTNVLFVGGSVTFAATRPDGSISHGYHVFFVNWLNERYPCNGGGHKLIVHGPGGTDSSYAVGNFNQLFRDADGPIDFVSFEYAVNDSSMAPKPGRSLGETIQIVNEILFRKALKYRNPQDSSAPAIISLETSFWVKNMMQKQMSSSNDAVHVFAPAYHFPIMTYYDVPSISAAQVWFPMFAKDMGQLGDNSSEIFNVFLDTCHPNTKGHFVVAQLLAYNIETEKAWMLQNKDMPLHRLERDLTLQDPPKLPNPWWLTDEEEALLVDAPVSEFDFQKYQPSADSLNYNTGWSIYDDSHGKNKFGLIATKSASHISFKIDLINFNRSTFQGGMIGGDPAAFKRSKHNNAKATPTNTLSLGYLMSYSNVSDAMVWTDNNPDGRSICHSTVEMSNSTAEVEWKQGVTYFRRGPGKGEMVRGKNTHQTSVFNSYNVLLSEPALDAAEQGKAIYLHTCNLPFNFGMINRKTPYIPVHGDSKFKLLLVMAINGHLGMKKSGVLYKMQGPR